MTGHNPITPTPLDHLVRSLRVPRLGARAAKSHPAAILWTDPNAEWSVLLPVARQRDPRAAHPWRLRPRAPHRPRDLAALRGRWHARPART